VVPIYSTYQWTSAGTFRYDAKAENPEILYILISVFLQPVQVQTDF